MLVLDAGSVCSLVGLGGRRWRHARQAKVAKPKTVLWEADEHTLAKHGILRAYLQAWLPTMSRCNDRLLLIDGFAGPGRYLGGEDGSPLIMLRTLLDHRSVAARRATTFMQMPAGVVLRSPAITPRPAREE
jgi:hypothetical protein